jgi:hypothetical protein
MVVKKVVWMVLIKVVGMGIEKVFSKGNWKDDLMAV